VFNSAVVQDEIDANGAPSAILTPALTRRLTACCSDFTFTYLQLRHGSNNVATVESEIDHILPANLPQDFLATSIEVAKADQALRPEAIALGAFGGIALLAVLLIAGQMIGRQLRSRAEEERALRSIGASPAMIVSDGLLGIMGAVVVGTLVAGTVAVALSPLAPLGPVRSVYPFRGLAFDWTVLGFGTLALVAALFMVGLLLASPDDGDCGTNRRSRPAPRPAVCPSPRSSASASPSSRVPTTHQCVPPPLVRHSPWLSSSPRSCSAPALTP
jgi:hypothetical protein